MAKKIILVTLNRKSPAGDAGTVLSVGSMLEVLVMGSGPPGFCTGGEGGGSCLGDGSPVSELFIHARALFQIFYF